LAEKGKTLQLEMGEWESIEMYLVERIVDSLPNKLAEVIANGTLSKQAS
jgi:hypothetical protein